MTIQGRQQVEVVDGVQRKIELAERERRAARFEHNFTVLLSGGYAVLKSTEFINDLTSFLVSDPAQDRQKKKDCLLAIQDGLLSDDTIIRERVLTICSVVSLHFLQYEDFEFLSLLVDGLLLWLEMETEIVPGIEQIFKRLRDIVNIQINHGRLEDGAKIVGLMAEMNRKHSLRHRSYASLAGKMLSEVASPSNLEQLCDSALVSEEDYASSLKILKGVGEPGIAYLFTRLVESPNKKERLRLIPLIADFEGDAEAYLQRKLVVGPHWSEIRNILSILGIIASPMSLPAICDCLRHEEKRVRIQALDCMRKIGGMPVKHALMKTLSRVDDGMKVQVIRTLVDDFGNDDQVFETLLEIAENRSNFGASSGLKLLHGIIGGLKCFPLQKTVDLLETMRIEYENIPQQEEILFLIDQTLNQVGPTLRRQKADYTAEEKSVDFDMDPLDQQGAFHCWKEIEAQVERLLGDQKVEDASKLIHERALQAVRDRAFGSAELLRDRLLEINPMFLDEAIALGELIEKKRGEDISDHYFSTWAELYATLSEEEFRAFYHECRMENYGSDEVVVKVGEVNPNLYFLNSGQLHLFCVDDGQDVFLKKLYPGDVSGWEPFFSASVWTVSLKTKGFVQLQVLDQDGLKNLEENFNGFGAKLEGFCRQRTRLPELLRMSGRDRRTEPRYAVTLIARNMLLDAYGNRGKRIFSGALIDVSRNGLAFSVGISSLENAKALLGRQLITVIDQNDGEELNCKGAIVGVRKSGRSIQEFTVHVRLSQKISIETFEKLVASTF